MLDDSNIDIVNKSTNSFCWASLIENELSGSIDDKMLKSNSICENEDENEKNKNNKNNKNENENNITLSEILSIDYNKINVRKLMEYQNIMANSLKGYIKQCMDNNEKIDYNLHIAKFNWLSNINNYLSTKLNLPNIPIKEINNKSKERSIIEIARSSYKFCEYSYDCEFNYPKNLKNVKKIRGCYKQHFVYNFLKTDIDSLIEYLDKIEKGTIQVNYDELYKCINTICYVINKMKDELENLHFRYGENYNKYHCERSVRIGNSLGQTKITRRENSISKKLN